MTGLPHRDIVTNVDAYVTGRSFVDSKLQPEGAPQLSQEEFKECLLGSPTCGTRASSRWTARCGSRG